MSAMAGRAVAAGGKTPAHLWVVGGLSLLWNAFGCFDFLMTNVRDPIYVSQLPPDMIDYIDAFPLWAIVSWGLGVWAALAGSLLLLGRSRRAGAAFALSFVGLAMTSLYQAMAGVPTSMDSPMNRAMTGLIWIVTVALLLYARRMRLRGVLS